MGSDDEREAVRRRRCARRARSARSCASSASGRTASSGSTRPASPADWAKDPDGNTKKIAETFRQAGDVAEDYGERLAAEGEICWGGMHSVAAHGRAARSWSTARRRVGFQADMAHTLLYTMGYNAPEDRILPENFDWSDQAALDEALKQLTRALRPWTIDFHVAQNDATVKGSGSHDKTGRHCLPQRSQRQARHRPARRLLAARRQRQRRRKTFQHICWDGCMFPNATMMQQQTWNDILGVDDRGPRRARLGLKLDRSRWRRRLSTSAWSATASWAGRTRMRSCRRRASSICRTSRCSRRSAARNADRVKAFAEQLGLRVGRDRLARSWSSARTSTSIDIASPNDTHDEIAIAAAKAGKMVMCEKPLGRNAAEARGDGRRGRGGRRAEHGLVQLPPRAGRHAGQAADRRGEARAHLPLPREVPAGLDDLARPAAGRRRAVAARRRGRRQRRHRRSARALHRHRAVAERSDRRSHRDDRDVHQGAQAQPDRQGRAGRHRRRERVPVPVRERLARRRSRRRATRAGTRRSTRSRSTASTRRRSGTCTTCTASSTSITATKGACAAGAASTSPTATSRT